MTHAITIPIDFELTPRSRAIMDAFYKSLDQRFLDPSVPATSTPSIGEIWPEQGGIYAGVSRGEDGAPDAHLVLLEAVPEQDLNWADALKWADGLGNGARLPTRFEAALLYANLHDKLDTERWHWTGTQSSASSAWIQYFSYGIQSDGSKSSEARARAVRRFKTLRIRGPGASLPRLPRLQAQHRQRAGV